MEEAAKLIAASGEEREEPILVKLTNAAGNNSLSTYMPGIKAKNEYRSKLDRFKTPCTFYDECYWDELNKWLDDNEPRITFRFAPPDAVQAGAVAGEITPKERRAQLDIYKERGVPRRIIENWDAIELEYGPKADAHQVLRLLKRISGAGGFDDKTALKTVQNTMIILRKRNLIP
ncbi:MAG: hypothetical protein ACOH2K_01885 [Burkholderiaceae bacterium]